MDNTAKKRTRNFEFRHLDAVMESQDGHVELQMISLFNLEVAKEQPRKYFDEEGLKELAQSIQQHGVLEPLLVRTKGKEKGNRKYEIIAGERRYRAAKLAGIPVVPARILVVDDEVAAQIALVENLQREDLNPVEETEGILKLLALKLNSEMPEVISLLYQMLNADKGKITHTGMGNGTKEQVEQVFSSLSSMSWQSFVQNRLPLLKFPEEVLKAIENGQIAYTKATLIARIKEEQFRTQLLKEAIEEKLTREAIRKRISEYRNSQKDAVAKSKKKEGEAGGLLKQIQDEIERHSAWENQEIQITLNEAITRIRAILGQSD